MLRLWCLLAASGLGVACAAAEDHWRLQYFLDEDSTALSLRDLKFPSPERGIAAGELRREGHAQPVVLLTEDSGEHWTQVQVPEAAQSLFFASPKLGWMVTQSGVWGTADGGRNWKRLARLRGLLRLYFLDEAHGWAVGSPKAVFETKDGGQHWTAVAAAAQPKSTPEFTTYNCLDFTGQRIGLIAGSSRPPRQRSERFPDWMEPEKAQRSREWPELTIFLETRDGGQNWRSSVTSMFGVVSQVRLAPDGRGLGVIRFFEAFQWPAEVFLLNWGTGRSTRVFRRADRDVTDALLTAEGTAYLAGIEPAGRLRQLPIPGKLKILRSRDFLSWEEMPVDYRAVATHVVLATGGAGQLWAATDTGMILKLTSQ